MKTEIQLDCGAKHLLRLAHEAALAAAKPGQPVLVGTKEIRKALAKMAQLKQTRADLRDVVDHRHGRICPHCGQWHYQWATHLRRCPVRKAAES